VDRGEQLLRLEGCRPGAIEEVRGRDAARRARSGRLELSVERERTAGSSKPICARSTPIVPRLADLEVTDHGQSLGNEWCRRATVGSCSAAALAPSPGS
jgi:hypothetical protein